jgi:hypothetical protein
VVGVSLLVPARVDPDSARHFKYYGSRITTTSYS